jgi:hypothetical protein
MRIKLADGCNGLDIDLPNGWDATVVRPRFTPALSHPRDALRKELGEPAG